MFPSLDAETVHQRTQRRWNLDGALPVPREGWLACPVCRTDQVQIRHWRFHIRADQGHTVPHRCDISFKCTDCAAVWVHGVVLSTEVYQRMIAGRRRPNSLITWREGKRLLEGEQCS